MSKIVWDRLSEVRVTVHDALDGGGGGETPFEVEFADGHGGWRQINTKGVRIVNDGPLPCVEVTIPLGGDFGHIAWESKR